MTEVFELEQPPEDEEDEEDEEANEMIVEIDLENERSENAADTEQIEPNEIIIIDDWLHCKT